MAIVTARYPRLQRRARTMSAAILLGQARRHAAERRWRDAVACAAAGIGTGGMRGLGRVIAAMGRARARTAGR